ncbi:MAG: hypothetical protein ABSF77_07760 [Spirochaetia bacterium]|jgi:hypothetical protein
MKTKYLLPLIICVLALTVPSWADSAAPINSLINNSSAFAPQGPDGQSSAALPELTQGDFFDTVPMFSLDLSRFDVGVDFLAQQITVWPKSVYGVGVMFTLKSYTPQEGVF